VIGTKTHAKLMKDESLVATKMEGITNKESTSLWLNILHFKATDAQKAPKEEGSSYSQGCFFFETRRADIIKMYN
jgi:hypothetical protein